LAAVGAGAHGLAVETGGGGLNDPAMATLTGMERVHGEDTLPRLNLMTVTSGKPLRSHLF